MSRGAWIVTLSSLLLLAGVAWAEDVPETEPVSKEKKEAVAAEVPVETGPKVISGMSILGNQEAPKSLVIVPWKSSEIGESLGISTMLDDSRQPVDREVFLRALSYYEIRSETMPPPGSGSVVLVDGND